VWQGIEIIDEIIGGEVEVPPKGFLETTALYF
jgi:hypothetical protein